MTSYPASARPRATTLAPRSCPSNPTLAIRMRSFRLDAGGPSTGEKSIRVAGVDAVAAGRGNAGVTAPATDPIRVENPGTGQPLGEVPAAGAAEVAAAVSRARAAQPAWAALPFAQRARALRRLARALRDDGELVDTLVAETGKTRYEAELFEVFYTMELTRYFTGRTGRRALA